MSNIETTKRGGVRGGGISLSERLIDGSRSVRETARSWRPDTQFSLTNGKNGRPTQSVAADQTSITLCYLLCCNSPNKSVMCQQIYPGFLVLESCSKWTKWEKSNLTQIVQHTFVKKTFKKITLPNFSALNERDVEFSS